MPHMFKTFKIWFFLEVHVFTIIRPAGQGVDVAAPANHGGLKAHKVQALFHLHENTKSLKESIISTYQNHFH